ncbi:hypothetical protein BX661DRAFT_170239 [Kickxella alabastrina]|uniref:uncharacterized protein n=1 Tax=Kickxella alabastrina TaxID=61397 RepID=UPI00221E3870|nr:uncharacterized protein BX661DRAFT_170239 [Kickxella alabastrina]KAI7831064.1 hypothetical protein BX661DRAFT_170239 [Kickxella alabastrina]KAJ1936046.1 hypothetical protein GGF37_005764 [Kickxella alabastrina]
MAAYSTAPDSSSTKQTENKYNENEAVIENKGGESGYDGDTGSVYTCIDTDTYNEHDRGYDGDDDSEYRVNKESIRGISGSNDDSDDSDGNGCSMPSFFSCIPKC